MSRSPCLWPIVVFAAIVSCSRAPSQTSSEPAPAPLAGYTAQRLMIAPTAAIRSDTALRWAEQLSGVARHLDSNIVRAFATRGITSQWFWPADLVRSYERNRSYGVDPYRLAVATIDIPRFKAGDKYPEPLSTQLRTMIAMHDDARFVLVPVHLRFEREGTTTSGRAVLRAAILDPRFAEARWVSDVRSDPSTSPAQALTSLASRLAELFVAP